MILKEIRYVDRLPDILIYLKLVVIPTGSATYCETSQTDFGVLQCPRLSS